MQPKPSSPSLGIDRSVTPATRGAEAKAAPPAPPANHQATSPRVEYSGELPIHGYRDQLINLIREHQAIVVCGETGSGKSTQLPKYCLQAGLGHSGIIGHTQPRRLAARSIASRLAEELETPLGSLVGYQIRFGDQTSDHTRIKLMTDGILLAETQSDPLLRTYDAIIVDEAHERSLNIDFLLGYLKRLQSERPELRIIITSATIDAERFAEHFGNDTGPAPIMTVEGRGYPVEIKYLPWEEVVNDLERGYDLARHVIAGIECAGRANQGDTLVFLPTERDIREVSHRVAGHYKRLGLEQRVDLLPLYARLPNHEQQRIFHPSGQKRRIIFATNVAESSLTVPGIRTVVDVGTARISRYSPRTKIQRLPIEPVSRASADQRAGRCGRIGPGVCVRLYSAAEYDARDAYTTPEIRRTNLAAVILRTKTLRLGPLEQFPLLDPPRPEAIREGLRTLIELGAIDRAHELTEIGWRLGRLPVDPRVGRILLAAEANGVLAEVLPIAAALEIQDPRDRPPEKQQQADEAHRRFTDPRSDFLSYLRLWRYYDQSRSDFSRNQLDRELRKQFLSPHRMREWSEVYRQLRELVAAKKIGPIRYAEDEQQLVSDDHYATIHQSLLAGLLSGVAQLGDKREYTATGGLKLFLWPGSGIFATPPKWIVAAELLETAKQYARTVARIEPGWIETVGAHLLKRSHSDPHWSGKSNGAFCYEQATLFGLTIYARRRVPLPPIDPATARDLLIERGLAEHELVTTARFVRHNRSIVESLMALAAKTRRRDLVVDSHAVLSFYQHRLPGDVYDRARIEQLDRALDVPPWTTAVTDAAGVSQWLTAPPPATSSECLYMRPDDLVAANTESMPDDAFPDELEIGQSRLPLEYHFEPGSERDGISVRVHQAALSQISEDRLGWLVPGLLEQKLVSMIKSLPKRIRRNLVPAADVAARIAAELQNEYGQKPFMPTVCAAISRHAEMPVTPTDFQTEKIDQNLNFLVSVVDDDGKIVAQGRDLQPLLGQAPAETNAATQDVADETWSRSSMRTFDIDELPREVIRVRGGVQVAQYPGLIDLGDAVATRLFSDLAAADAALRQGVLRLYALSEHKELRAQVRWLPSLPQSKLQLTGIVSVAEIENALIDLLARIAFVEGETVVRTRTDFETRRGQRGPRIAKATQDVAPWLSTLGESYFAVRRTLESLPAGGRHAAMIHDVRQQLAWLCYPQFLSRTPWQWLQHYPRYLKGIDYRLEKVRSGAASRDAETMQSVQDLWSRWLAQHSESQRQPLAQIESEFRWSIEELRVSLFAQPLGTSIKVSIPRCEKML
jgi:ATP-dependent helicase HrpA